MMILTVVAASSSGRSHRWGPETYGGSAGATTGR